MAVLKLENMYMLSTIEKRLASAIRVHLELFLKKYKPKERTLFQIWKSLVRASYCHVHLYWKKRLREPDM